MTDLYSWGEVQYSPPWRGGLPDSVPETWVRAEEVLREKFDLVEDHTPYCDAREQDGTPVEIKSCALRYEDGRLGRFEIWGPQEEELLHDGKVALLVYMPTSLRPIIATHMTRPIQLLWKGSLNRTQHPTMGQAWRRRIKWPDIIPLEAIRYCSRRAFLDHYSEEEIEGVMLPKPNNGEATDDGSGDGEFSGNSGC